MAQIGTICNRIAVIQKGRIVELVETEKLFDHPIHPYTRALLSAIPMPNPDVEQNKTLRVYEPVRYARWEQGTVWEPVEKTTGCWQTGKPLKTTGKSCNMDVGGAVCG